MQGALENEEKYNNNIGNNHKQSKARKAKIKHFFWADMQSQLSFWGYGKSGGKGKIELWCSLFNWATQRKQLKEDAILFVENCWASNLKECWVINYN